MKLIKKTIICLILAMACIMTIFSFSACGNKPTEGLEYTAVLGEGGAPISYSVTGMGSATANKIVIPSTYQGLPVTEVGSYAFSMKSNITSVSIPESVTVISDYAFSACSSLKKVSLPESVTYLGNAAFIECTSLTSVTVPANVKIFGTMVFARCTALKTVKISEGVTSIGIQMFQGCTALTNLTVPDSVTSYGLQSFMQCTALSSVKISENVNVIGMGAFSGCTNLKSATFAVTDGWTVTTVALLGEEAKTEAVSKENLSDKSLAATYLTTTHSNKSWYRD